MTMPTRGATVITVNQAEAELRALNPGCMSRRAEAVLPSRRGFPPALLRVLRLTDCNSFCVDCGRREDGVGDNADSSMRLAWANVSYGTTLCGKCAMEHLSSDDETSSIVNFESGQWTLPYVVSMLEGGNNSFLVHLKYSGSSLDSIDPKHRYGSNKPVAVYRMMLADKTEWALKAQGYAMPDQKSRQSGTRADGAPARALSKERAQKPSGKDSRNSRPPSSSTRVGSGEMRRSCLKKEDSRRFPASRQNDYVEERANPERKISSVSSIRRTSATRRTPEAVHDSASSVVSPLSASRHSDGPVKRESLRIKKVSKSSSSDKKPTDKLRNKFTLTKKTKQQTKQFAEDQDYTYLGHSSFNNSSSHSAGIDTSLSSLNYLHDAKKMESSGVYTTVLPPPVGGRSMYGASA